MPRTARLDMPGLMQHVIVRGSDRQAIFRDDVDRGAFCDRLSVLLADTGTQCLAWALIPNHFHLLLRPVKSSLAMFMRRLLTGYVGTFNRRHHRCGHLLQNRYKSIVCDEEEYLLELVRYIHLNPLRAGLTVDMAGLAQYPWSGHAVLLGQRELPGQEVDEVLERFGRQVGEAREGYESFVAAGAGEGRREELVGGGLRRSLVLLGQGEEPESYDARVLGSGAFVERLREEEELRDRIPPQLSVAELVGRVARAYDLTPERIQTRSTKPAIAEARGVVCYVAVHRLGLRGTEVGRVLGLTDSGASRAVARGRGILRERPGLLDQLLGKP